MFNVRLKELRKSRNLTQKQVAFGVEMTDRGFQDLEYGNVKPSHDTIIALCKYFDVSADWLLGLSDNPKPNK